jgi:ABC-type branched-subunit amino acid transport system substrate-binding protein
MRFAAAKAMTAATLAMAVTACGSTLQAGQGGGTSADLGYASAGSAGTTGSTSDGGLSLPGAASGSRTAGVGTGPGPATTGGTRTGNIATVTTAPAASAPATSTTAGATGPIRVGFETIQGGNQLIASGLGTPVNFGNGHQEIKGIVDDINKHGGVNGRKIQPFFGDWNAASQENGREADCTKLTEDDKVSFIITVVNMSEGYVACAARHNVPVINASFGAGDDYMYRQFSLFLYSASLMDLNTEESLVLQTGRAGGRVAATKKVGVVIDDTPPGDPQYDRVLNATVVPVLKAWGVPYETFGVATQADVNSAVLRFRADGVKTVLFIAPSGIIEILFMQAAEQQGYRPDYILGDSTATWFIGEAAPLAQVQHITGAGSLPVSNVPESQYPTTAREKKCFAVIRAAGESNNNRHNSVTATPYCEATWEFVAIASKVSGALTPASFYAAYPTVRDFAPVTTFSINFASGRHSAAAQYRTLGYMSKCQCISYTSGLRRVP